MKSTLSCERDWLYLLVGDKLNTKKLLVVLECLKDRAFDSTDCLRSLVIMPLARPVAQLPASNHFFFGVPQRTVRSPEVPPPLDNVGGGGGRNIDGMDPKGLLKWTPKIP